LVLLFVLSSGAILGRTASAAAPTDNNNVLYVSPSGSDTTGSGSFASPFATITHAVAQAASFYASSKNASTIIVEAGTYHEMVVITTPIDLISANGMPLSTIINATGLTNGIVVVGPSAAGTVVEGFATINANNHGIYVQDSSNVRIENNFASNNGVNVQAGVGEDKAIQLAGASDSAIDGNTIVGNLYGGAGITDDGAIDPSWNATAAPGSNIPAGTPNPGNNNTISGNTIINNRPNHCAIVVSSYNQGEGVSNNIVSDNVVVDNQNGIILAADTPNTVAINNTVISNNIVDNGEGGVIVHSNAPGDVVTGNAILSNVISGNGYLPTLEGVIVGGDGPVAAVNTLIQGNTFQNEAIGIKVVNGNNTMVGGNTMTATVKAAYNGTVTQIPSGSGSGSGTSSPSTVTVSITQTSTASVTQTSTASVTQTSTASITQTVTSTAAPVSTTITSTTSSSSGGLSFDVALITAVVTLIVGLVAGMIARPIRESAGR